MATFENPQNGYRESTGTVGPFLFVLLLGPIGFALYALWGAAAILFVFALALCGLGGAIGIAIYLVIQVAAAFAAPSTLREHYLKRGWRQVKGNAPPAKAAEERMPCPFCAEAILPAAKICPHCRSTLPEPAQAKKRR